MVRIRLLVPAVVGLILAVGATSALAANTFRPRVKGALGLVPPVGHQDIASGSLTPVVYHGGSVMAGGVTVHTIFWAPTGHTFQGSPGAGVLGYEPLIKQYFTDVAHDSSPTANNEFSVLTQYGEGTAPGAITPGAYKITYGAADSLDDTKAYPVKADQCASPADTSVCITDAQISAEAARVAGTHTGLHDLWFVFLPPDVDECITPGVCGTNAFAGYHSVFEGPNGPVIYAVAIDPAIEVGNIAPGQDPEGNPDAESSIQTAGHETNEAMTDPEGVGWMDPNGFEIGDKCENPEYGPPLGYAADKSPFNQVINGHDYLVQEMWANEDSAGNPDCVQSTTKTGNALPLPQVNLTQFSSTVTGNIESATAGVGVEVKLIRADANGDPVVVADGKGTTGADGSWSVSLAPHAVGDDRDQIDVIYSGTGAPSPSTQVILTGNGGNPFLEAGWTGWTALDNGTFLTDDATLGGPSLTVGPCFQTGVFGYSIGGTAGTQSLNDNCNTQSDTATVSLASAVTAGQAVTVTSNDNRAFDDLNDPPLDDSGNPAPNGTGGLVSLTVPVGEPDAASQFANPLGGFFPSGFPSCTADVELLTVTCTGLVPSGTYSMTDGSQTASAVADATGTAVGHFAPFVLTGGSSVVVSNGAQTLSTLHIASLKVNLTNEATTVSSGSCSPGEYYGAGLSSVPLSSGAGQPSASVGGGALTGEICPMNGDATGLSTAAIAQTDEQSGGQTQTEVPDLENTSPMLGETVYGGFTALAQSGLPGPDNATIPTDGLTAVALYVTKVGDGQAVKVSDNVDTASGVDVPALAPGAYNTAWVITDLNGDTRTVYGRFVEEPAAAGQQGQQGQPGPQGPPGPRGPQGPPGPKPKVSCKLVKHHKIKCKVTFPKKKKSNDVSGTVRVEIERGSHVAALGHAAVRHGVATVTMHQIRTLRHGRWTMTLVLAQRGRSATTTTVGLRLR